MMAAHNDLYINMTAPDIEILDVRLENHTEASEASEAETGHEVAEAASIPSPVSEDGVDDLVLGANLVSR